MTLGGMQAIHSLGFEISDHISVVGFDDMDWTPSLRPSLTVVAQPVFEMGEAAATLLLERIPNPSFPPQTRILDTHLVLRASCWDLLSSTRTNL